MSDPDEAVTVEELAGYCQTQARLLHGQVETIDAETAALLSEIDAELSAVQDELADRGRVESAQSPPAPDAGAGDDLAALEAREAELGEKQAVVEAKQARRNAFEELAVAYLELAEELASASPDPSTALQRVVTFEAERDAQAYFDERLTLLEAGQKGDTDGE